VNADKLVNAWIFMDDHPDGTNYNSPTSSYQRLIARNIYQAVDILSICFLTTVPTSAKTVPQGNGSSYTLSTGPATHPGGLTDQDYMLSIIRDARKNNPGIKITVTLDYGGDGRQIENIFSPPFPPPTNALSFAANVMTYLKTFNLDGFDIDWEWPISNVTDKTHFGLVVSAIGAQFKQQPAKHYLTLSPNEVGNLDASAVNAQMDFVNLQLYGSANPSDFVSAGVNASLFTYGASWESGRTAEEAYQDNSKNYSYPRFMCWRLNSGNFVFEQTQQQQLYKLFKGGVEKPLPAVPEVA
jgi:hypothetical protein